jgi:pimeloyl-ACP methyl ester carboxylesterase
MQRAPDRESEGFFAGLAQKYDSIWQTFILPERMTYHKESLGPQYRRLDRDKVFQRIDFTCSNVRGEKLESSIFRLQENERSDALVPDTCLLYLHSHGGNRLEGLSLIRQAGAMNMNLCCFDFAGSGLSEGKYTTLGLRESEDCRAVVESLMKNHGQRRFVLWGRSMGAVAAIMYAAGSTPHVKSLVLDSPFSDVEQMVRDAGNSYISLGEYLALFLFSMVKNDIKQHIGQDLSTFQPIKFCHLCEAPCVFIVGKGDPLVPPERVQQMLDAYKGTPKELMVIDGSHSSGRMLADIEKVCEKVARHLQLEVSHIKPNGNEYFDPNVKYGHAMLDKFGELDSILSQKRLEKKMASRELQPKSTNDLNKPYSSSQREADKSPKNVNHSSKDAKPANYYPIKPTTEIHFSIAPPRYIDFSQSGLPMRPEAPQLRNLNKLESVRAPIYKPEAHSPFKVMSYTQSKDGNLNKENIHLVSNSGYSRNKTTIEPRKSTTFSALGQNQPSPSFHHQNRQLAQSDRSSSRNLIFSQGVQKQQIGGFQYQMHSPLIQADSSLRTLTQINPFQVSPSSQKEVPSHPTTKMSRPSSPMNTEKPMSFHQRQTNSSFHMNQNKQLQDSNLLEQQLRTGQLKAALQHRIREKQPVGPQYETFSSFHLAGQHQPKMHRTDSSHQLYPGGPPQTTSKAPAMEDPFGRSRKSFRQVKIFDDLDDSPRKDNTDSLFNHSINIYPGPDRDMPAPKLRPEVYGHHSSSFR